MQEFHWAKITARAGSWFCPSKFSCSLEICLAVVFLLKQKQQEGTSEALIRNHTYLHLTSTRGHKRDHYKIKVGLN
jgi:hypothetical protein